MMSNGVIHHSDQLGRGLNHRIVLDGGVKKVVGHLGKPDVAQQCENLFLFGLFLLCPIEDGFVHLKKA